MVEDAAELVVEFLVDAVVVTIEDKVKEITNSNVVHNNTGNIYGESVLRTRRVALTTSKYTDDL